MKSLFVFTAARRFWSLILLLGLLVAAPARAAEPAIDWGKELPTNWVEYFHCMGWNKLGRVDNISGLAIGAMVKVSILAGISMAMAATDEASGDNTSTLFWPAGKLVKDVIPMVDAVCIGKGSDGKMLMDVMKSLALSKGV